MSSVEEGHSENPEGLTHSLGENAEVAKRLQDMVVEAPDVAEPSVEPQAKEEAIEDAREAVKEAVQPETEGGKPNDPLVSKFDGEPMPLLDKNDPQSVKETLDWYNAQILRTEDPLTAKQTKDLLDDAVEQGLGSYEEDEKKPGRVKRQTMTVGDREIDNGIRGFFNTAKAQYASKRNEENRRAEREKHRPHENRAAQTEASENKPQTEAEPAPVSENASSTGETTRAEKEQAWADKEQAWADKKAQRQGEFAAARKVAGMDPLPDSSRRRPEEPQRRPQDTEPNKSRTGRAANPETLSASRVEHATPASGVRVEQANASEASTGTNQTEQPKADTKSVSAEEPAQDEKKFVRDQDAAHDEALQDPQVQNDREARETSKVYQAKVEEMNSRLAPLDKLIANETDIPTRKLLMEKRDKIRVVLGDEIEKAANEKHDQEMEATKANVELMLKAAGLIGAIEAKAKAGEASRVTVRDNAVAMEIRQDLGLKPTPNQENKVGGVGNGPKIDEAWFEVPDNKRMWVEARINRRTGEVISQTMYSTEDDPDYDDDEVALPPKSVLDTAKYLRAEDTDVLAGRRGTNERGVAKWTEQTRGGTRMGEQVDSVYQKYADDYAQRHPDLGPAYARKVVEKKNAQSTIKRGGGFFRWLSNRFSSRQ